MKRSQLRDKMQLIFDAKHPDFGDFGIRKDISFVPMFENNHRGKYLYPGISGYIPGYKTLYFLCGENGLQGNWDDSKTFTSIRYRRLVEEAHKVFSEYSPSRNKIRVSEINIL